MKPRRRPRAQTSAVLSKTKTTLSIVLLKSRPNKKKVSLTKFFTLNGGVTQQEAYLLV